LEDIMATEAKAASNGPGIEVTILKPDDVNLKRVHVQARTAYAPQTGWVMQLVQACAMPQPDGVTPSGHQAYRLPSPEEALTRAFAIADGVFAEFEKRGWSAPLPALDELRNSEGGPVGFLSKKAGE
jgi:hypothetical protein